ncbi:unnamed protein product [Orchesella dallaii]|uniref:Uncharacterized protein n=1 Tax=Orchesella dallaii TaxID=48710 RepID=A0ABP1PVK9_9HEXA
MGGSYNGGNGGSYNGVNGGGYYSGTRNGSGSGSVDLGDYEVENFDRVDGQAPHPESISNSNVNHPVTEAEAFPSASLAAQTNGEALPRGNDPAPDSTA